MLEFDLTLGPFRLRLVIGESYSEPQPQGDVYASVERADEEWVAEESGRISLRA